MMLDQKRKYFSTCYHIIQINIDFLAVQQSIDHIKMLIICSAKQWCDCTLIINKYIFPSTKNSTKKKKKKKKKTYKKKKTRRRDEFWKVDGEQNQHFPLDLIPQINIHFVTVQQSIDHIQMPIRWSLIQCRTSVLPFNIVNKNLKIIIPYTTGHWSRHLFLNFDWKMEWKLESWCPTTTLYI